MTWFKKALKFVQDVAEATAPEAQKGLVRDIGHAVNSAPGFFKLTAEMVHAGAVNVEENVARGYRSVTGTGGRPVFNTQEGPLKSSVSLQDTAAFSQMAYSDGGGERKGYHTLQQKSVKDLSFSVYQSDEDGHVVVSFRGSSNIDNWHRNMNMRTVDDGFGNKVHGGFKSAWDDMKPYVDSALHEIFHGGEFTNNVTFTGHSLGGAISQLATADYMREQNPRLIYTVTYASPTVGYEGFNARIPGGHMMRVVDPRDSVPKVVQKLQPDLKSPDVATRVIAIGDKDKRINDKVKKDAIRFGIDVAFDLGIALILAYAPEVDEAAELGEGVLAEEEGGLATIAEEGLAAAKTAAGAGEFAEEEAISESVMKQIGGEGGENITMAERMDIRALFNPGTRREIAAQLKTINKADLLEGVVRDALGNVDWELTAKTAMVKAGVTTAAQNLVIPFLHENGLGDVDEDGMVFLLNNGWDFMYGAVQAHPMGTYVDNIHNQFGSRRDNAREDMWNNYLKNQKKQGVDDEDLIEFMTDEELQQYQDEFAHGDDDGESEDVEGDPEKPPLSGEGGGDEDDEDDEDGDEPFPEPEPDDQGAHNFHLKAGHEANHVSGRPLEVSVSRSGRKSDGSPIFTVVSEDGQTLSYTGPSHAASTTTLYGKWTGIAPFANSLPQKVSRTNAFGGEAFSALDTFSLAYLVNSYESGYHNEEADNLYKQRISKALENGFISQSIDGDEYRTARMILKEFEESGHLFSAKSGSITRQGNMLSELKVMSRGSLNDSADGVDGVSVSFSRGEKRKMDRAFETPEGEMVASEVMRRDMARIKGSEVTGTNVLENSAETIDFNMRVLKVLGMNGSPEFSFLENGVKQTAHAYKTALNVEKGVSEYIQSRGNAETYNGIFPNALGSSLSHDLNRDEDLNLSGNEEYLKDRLVLEILKTVL